MTGPYHHKRAEDILAEIEAANAVSNGTETALAIRAQAHSILALAVATAIDPCTRFAGVAGRGGDDGFEPGQALADGGGVAGGPPCGRGRGDVVPYLAICHGSILLPGADSPGPYEALGKLSVARVRGTTATSLRSSCGRSAFF